MSMLPIEVEVGEEVVPGGEEEGEEEGSTEVSVPGQGELS